MDRKILWIEGEVLFNFCCCFDGSFNFCVSIIMVDIVVYSSINFSISGIGISFE